MQILRFVFGRRIIVSQPRRIPNLVSKEGNTGTLEKFQWYASTDMFDIVNYIDSFSIFSYVSPVSEKEFFKIISRNVIRDRITVLEKVRRRKPHRSYSIMRYPAERYFARDVLPFAHPDLPSIKPRLHASTFNFIHHNYAAFLSLRPFASSRESPFSRDTGGNLTKIKNSFKNVKGKEKEERSQIRFVLNAHEFLLHECRGTIEFIHRGE